MTIFDELKGEVYLNLEGYARSQEQATHLPSPISATAVNFAVADAGQVSRGVVEIDDELLYIDSKDATGNTVTAPPYGRGYGGTTATSHAAGVRVTINPRFPRASIGRAINETIRSTYPDIWAVGTTTFPYRASVLRYALPTDADRVIAADWLVPGPSDVFQPVSRWREDVTASEVRIEVRDMVVPGQTVRVTYATRPVELDDLSTDFTDTGLDLNARDLVVYGACARLLGYSVGGRLQSEAVETQERGQGLQSGELLNAGRYFYQLYKQRLSEEQRRLQLRYPARIHMVR